MDIKWLIIAFTVVVVTCSAQRQVTVQPGPLIRTEGSHITIWCNVTGYKEGVEQDFEWSMYLYTAPDREIRIVSTSQHNYAYALYAQRVNSKDIYIERLSGDSVLLHITKLQATDQGMYECYTPNTDSRYLGSYSARTNLTVIPDSLAVTAAAQTLAKVEGDTLQLSCEVTRQTSQHTHVSVGWFLRPTDDPSSGPRDLVTLSRDFVLRPGGQYRQRLSSGDLRLDKTSATSYRLTIYKLQPSDQGEFYCEASEWIQDPDRSWYALTRKESEKTSVKVQPTDRDFSIQVTTDRRAYTAGEPLELRCTIDAQNVPERFFSVSWVFSSSPVAVIGPSAVPALGPNYVDREAAGLLTVRKESPSVHLLKLQRLLPEDSGKYICRVTEREKTLTGDFIDRSKRSRNVQITVTPLRSNITVSLSSNTSEIMEGESIQLTCVVGSTMGPLSVTWQWTDKDGAGPAVNVAFVDREGTVTPGPTFRERSSFGEIRVERVQPDTFTLFLYNAFPTDEGQYRCSATEWSQSGSAPDWNWQQIGDESAIKTVTVKSVESFFFVSASSRTPSVTFGDSFDLQCIVKPRHNPNVPAAVTWRFQPAEGDGEFKDLVTFTRDGTLQWGDQLLGLGTRTTVDRTPTNTNFRLSITRAGRKEAGTYQCAALLFRRNYDGTWSTVANRTSNPLGISVLQPVSKLKVHKSNQSLQFLEDSRVRVNCSVSSQTSLDSQHAVLWYARKAEAGQPDELLLKIEHTGAFEYGAYAEEERLRSRVQSERLSPRLYGLTLHRAETSDSGVYYCLVEEWLMDPDGEWYRLAQDSSGFTHVAVRQPVEKLQVEEAESNITIPEDGSIRLGCSILSQSSKDSRFSVSWYVYRLGQEEEDEKECVFSIGHDAVFGNGNCSPTEEPGPNSRLQFERTTSDLYSLTIQKARARDAGNYYCHVGEWLLNPRNEWYQLATKNSGITIVNVMEQVSTIQSVVCSNDSLFYFVFFYPFPIFGILLIAVLLVRYKSRSSSKNQEGKNGAPLLWIKEPHLSYSPTCLDPPALSLHPGSVE
ncbi:immunoglobulin superfamily member 3 precursor [Danio rerio]|uniref:immunoglobulin superfamily member 3 precursor n=1 Tax=Danio rerio TaxID=7955 RepID=UPI00015D470C|nr:immunoglobulin superfamily member 3 precursor [Danio rerio]|eukprot:NP_001153138.1 immunoglobulin superfamily member 3 precursor [Danio rerio]